MRAKRMADYWVPYAQENDMVLVLPQVNHCWDVGQFNEFDAVGGIISTEENEVNDHLTKNGFQMEFMNQIIEQVKKPLDEKVEYIFEASSRLAYALSTRPAETAEQLGIDTSR